LVEKGNKIWSTRKGNLSLDYTLVKKRKTVSIARLPKYSLLRGLRLDKINSSVKCSQTIGFRKKKWQTVSIASFQTIGILSRDFTGPSRIQVDNFRKTKSGYSLATRFEVWL
jgi:hypothetical protein